MGYLAKSAYFERGLLAEDKWEQITLPIIVIAEMLGVAARDLAQFKRWSDARSQIFNMARTPEQTAESAAARQGLEARGGFHYWRRPRDSEPPGHGAHPGPTCRAAENHSRNPN